MPVRARPAPPLASSTRCALQEQAAPWTSRTRRHPTTPETAGPETEDDATPKRRHSGKTRQHTDLLPRATARPGPRLPRRCVHGALLKVKPDNPGLTNSLAHLQANAAAKAAKQAAKACEHAWELGARGTPGRTTPRGRRREAQNIHPAVASSDGFRACATQPSRSALNAPCAHTRPGPKEALTRWGA